MVLSKRIRNQAKLLGLRVTIKRGNRRVYKSKAALSKQIQNKLKRKTRKPRRTRRITRKRPRRRNEEFGGWIGDTWNRIIGKPTKEQQGRMDQWSGKRRQKVTPIMDEEEADNLRRKYLVKQLGLKDDLPTLLFGGWFSSNKNMKNWSKSKSPQMFPDHTPFSERQRVSEEGPRTLARNLGVPYKDKDTAFFENIKKMAIREAKKRELRQEVNKDLAKKQMDHINKTQDEIDAHNWFRRKRFPKTNFGVCSRKYIN